MSIAVQLHRRRIRVGVKMEVGLIFVINVAFIHRLRINYRRIQRCIRQVSIQMIEIYEKTFVFCLIFFVFDFIGIIFREHSIVLAINVRIVAQPIQLYGDEMPAEKVFVMLVVFIINYTG